MNILTANIVVYLTRYAALIRQFFKNKYIVLFIESLKWALFAYVFYILKGYGVTLCYMYLIIYEAMKKFKMNKNVLINLLVFLTSLLFLYFSGKYYLFYVLPFVALFINMVLKTLFKNKYNKYFDVLINIIICVYSYKYRLYVLFIFKLFEIIFPAVGCSIKSLTDYTNKKIN